MKFEIKNLGPVKEANIELGDLTIICGKNNSGKTRIAYAIYDFFKLFRKYTDFKLDEKNIKDGDAGSKKFNIKKVRLEVAAALKESAQKFAAARLNGADFKIEFDEDELALYPNAENWHFRNSEFLVKQRGATCTVRRIDPDNTDNSKAETQPSIDDFIRAFINTIFLSSSFQKKILPNSFAITTERTGLSVFRKVINIGNSRIVQNLAGDVAGRNVDLFSIPEEITYPLAIQHNLEYFNRLEDVNKINSFLSADKKIIAFLDEIISGKYEIAANDYLTFTPKGTKTKLPMRDSSSSVRALLLLDFYIRHSALEGDLLLIDEPELNLHPENQRKLARLLAMLVNSGIKVFITTHSDYIIKELNTLIMLSYPDDPRMPALQKKYGYASYELLNAERIRVYCAESKTATTVEVSPDVGIGISSFDDNIRQMGKMQRDILYGDKKDA